MQKYFLLAVLFVLPAHAHDELLEGYFTYGNEVSTFKACNSDDIYWLSYSGFLMSQVKSLALAQPKPYTSIFLKFRGHEHFEEVDGYQAQYKRQLHLSEVISFNVEIPSNCG